MSHLERLSESFPDIPPLILLKAELLRGGLDLSTPELVRSGGRRPGERHALLTAEPSPIVQLQGSIALPGGIQAFVAHNPKSPYVLLDGDDRPATMLGVKTKGGIEPVCEVAPGPRFRWTTEVTSRGTPLAVLFAPSIGGACGPLAVSLLRNCEYTSTGDECRFCPSIRAGRYREVRPDPDDMREAITRIRGEQGTIGYLSFSGGSLVNRSREADAFIEYMRIVRATGVPLPPSVAAIQALERSDSMRLRAAGFDYGCYSMEVWDARAWAAVLPGKNRAVGRERWMACLKDAVDVFGAGRVLCNFVAGVETAAPGVFRSIEEAVDSTLDGMRWCYDNGIYPKYGAWIVRPGAAFGDREPAPLEYFVRLMVGRQKLYREYDMRIPATDCQRCLTQSFEADLARLDPARYAAGPAGIHQWHKAHPPAHSADSR